MSMAHLYLQHSIILIIKDIHNNYFSSLKHLFTHDSDVTLILPRNTE